MYLFFAKADLVDRWPPDGPVSPEEARRLLEYRGIVEGTPVFLDSQMRPVEWLCAWFRQLSYENRDPETMKAYAYIVRRLVEFLAKRGADLGTVTEADLVAFRRSRTELQKVPVDDGTWDRDAVVINLMYTFFQEQGYVRRKPVRLKRNGGNGLSSGVQREMDLRHMTVEQYLYFRDVGLGGQLPGAEINESFRGWAPHRSKAGLELALLTGMRKQEWSTLLLPEIGEGWWNPGEPVEFDLQECAKYKHHRKVYIPTAALETVGNYCLLERSEMVERSARALARKAKDLFVVDTVDIEQGKLKGIDQGRRRTYTISAMSPALRRRTVRECEGGLEALAVFVGHGGLMLGPNSWDRIRKDAWRRMKEHSTHELAPPLPRKAWRFHDARHTFALQLLKYLMRLVAEQDAARAKANGLPTVGDHIAFNPLLVLQRRLGHQQLSSTYTYLRYLEDPMNYIDDAFRAWSEHDGATYSEIALRALEGEVPDAASR